MRLYQIADEVLSDPLARAAFKDLHWEGLELNDFGKIYKFLHDTQRLPSLSPMPEKSSIRSNRLLTSGNDRDQDNRALAYNDYTDAIIAAPPNSIAMAKAYEYRSSLLYYLQKYDDAIKDIDRALSIPVYPEDMRKSIIEGKEICRKAIAAKKRTSADTLVLSHNPSAAVDMAFSLEMGRHLIAATDIKPGEILSIEKPYVSVMRRGHHSICHHCKRECYSNIPCLSRFTCSSLFCSETCRQSSLKAYHSIECPILFDLYDLSYDDRQNESDKMTLLALRILLIASKCGDELLKLSDVTCEAWGQVKLKDLYAQSEDFIVANLTTNFLFRSRENIITLGVYATCLVHLLKEGTEFFVNSEQSLNRDLNTEQLFAERCSLTEPDLSLSHLTAAQLLFKYLMIADINGHSFGGADRYDRDHIKYIGFPFFRQWGCAIYPFHCLLNHSCDPNVACFTFRGDSSFMVAVQPIRKGEQLFCAYFFNNCQYTFFDKEEDSKTRQKDLKERYHFTCSCRACTQNWTREAHFSPVRFKINSPDKRTTAQLADRIKRLAESLGLDTGGNLLRFSALMESVSLKVYKGSGTEEDLEFLREYMTLAIEICELPCSIVADCQDAIKWYILKQALPELFEEPKPSGTSSNKEGHSGPLHSETIRPGPSGPLRSETIDPGPPQRYYRIRSSSYRTPSESRGASSEELIDSKYQEVLRQIIRVGPETIRSSPSGPLCSETIGPGPSGRQRRLIVRSGSSGTLPSETVRSGSQSQPVNTETSSSCLVL